MSVYLDKLREYERKPKHIGDELAWSHWVDMKAGILATKDDGLLCGFEVVPMSLRSLPKAVQGNYARRINDAYKILETNSRVWTHVQLLHAPPRPVSVWTNPVAAFLDAEARAVFDAPDAAWTSRFILTFWQRPPSKLSKFLYDFFYYDSTKSDDDVLNVVDRFNAACDRFITLLELACQKVTRLNGDQLKTYLHSQVSPRDHEMLADAEDEDLAYRLPTVGVWPGPRVTRGTEFEKEYYRCISLKENFRRRTSMVMFRDFFTKKYRANLTMRWHPLSTVESEELTTKKQVKWAASKDTSLKTFVFKGTHNTKDKNPLENRFLEQQTQDADIAREAALSDKQSIGNATINFSLWDTNPRRAQEHIRDLGSLIIRTGLDYIDEDDNSMEVLLGNTPGQVVANVRHLPLKSGNVAGLGPWQKPWDGILWSGHFDGPPLCWAWTEGSIPFGVDFHVGDLGSVIQVGSKGAGKSTANNWYAICSRQRRRSAVTIFDIDGSAMCTTYAMGGKWYDVAQGLPIQILAYVDDDRQLPHIYQWLCNRVRESGLEWDPDIGLFLMGGLQKMREQPERPRRIQELIYLLTASQSSLRVYGRAHDDDRAKQLASGIVHKVLAALQLFSAQGMFGKLVDAPKDELTFTDWECFELGEFMNQQDAYPAVFEILFHRARQARDGRPHHRQFNEAWHMFKNPTLISILADEMPGERKANIYSLFSTQNLDQLRGTPITSLLLDSCHTRMFLPNAQALTKENREAYEDMQLHREEIEALARARPKRDIYFVTPEGSAMIDQYLPPAARRICGATDRAILPKVQEVYTRYGPQEFAWRWLDAGGLHEQAQQLRQQMEAACLAGVAD